MIKHQAHLNIIMPMSQRGESQKWIDDSKVCERGKDGNFRNMSQPNLGVLFLLCLLFDSL